MLPPIVIGAHPKRRDREPIELGLTVSRLTGAPIDVVGTFLFDTTQERRAADEYGDVLREEVQAAGGTDRPPGEVRLHVLPGSPAQALHETASEVGAGLIVVGSTHRGGVGRITLSTTADRVLRQAPCPVAVAPRDAGDDADEAREGVAVAFVDTPGGRSALRAGAAIARCAATSLTAYTVIEGHTNESDRDRAEHAVEEAIAELAGDLDAEMRILARGGVEELVAASRRHSFLVRGCRARGPVRPPLAFGLPSKLARQAACPLVIVPPGREEPLEALFGAHAAVGQGEALSG
jgi:nucleotide-binding universal stress UspA family protein